MEEELAGDVDFDFFDEGEHEQSPKKLSDPPSSASPTVKGKPPMPAGSKPAKLQNGDTDRVEKRDVDNKEKEDISSDDSGGSDSYSSDYESDEDKKEVKTIETTIPTGDTGGRRSSPRSKTKSKLGNKSDGSDSEGSSSAYSDGSDDESPRGTPSPKSQTKNRKEAWNTESRDASNSSAKERKNLIRPKSGHPGNSSRSDGTVKSQSQPRHKESHSASDSSDSDSYSSDSDTDSSCTKSTSHKSGSDSEITDVSPLQSAETSPVLKRKHQKHVAVISAPQKDYKLYKELPDASYHGPGGSHRDKVPSTASDTMEFKLLMQAVAELDNEKQQRLKASSRRVMFESPKVGQNHEKGNYSFSNTQIKAIELENQRLLEEIMRKRLRKKKTESVKVSPPVVRRMPNSAVNRFKNQRRIEQENLAFLKRLQTIKPTRGITRNEQLHDYRRQMLYGVPSNMLDKLSARSQSPYQGSMGRTRSMSSVHSTATTTSLASTSASSCRTRPQSAKKASVDSRPLWEEQW